MADALTGTLITASVSIAGWYATYAYTKAKEDRIRRLEIRLKYKARQIEELYGPLFSLVQGISNVWTVRQNILEAAALDESAEQKVREYIWSEYFRPLHHEISTLLRTKLYLLEGSTLPKSFDQYLLHSTQQACQKSLYRDLNISTLGARGIPWPPQFEKDIKKTLDKLMLDYQTGVAELNAKTSHFRRLRRNVRQAATKTLARIRSLPVKAKRIFTRASQPIGH